MTDPLKRPSLREAARRGVEAKRQAQAAQVQPAAAPPAAPKPDGPTVARVEQVPAKCGHPVPFELYPDGRDKWREQRRKQITDKDCPECRKKAHVERQAAEMEAAHKRRQGRPKQDGRAQDPPARLPHGSRFDVTYDAATERWSGTLTIPASEGGEPRVFTGTEPGVFRLLRVLDQMYRGALANLAESPSQGPAG